MVWGQTCANGWNGNGSANLRFAEREGLSVHGPLPAERSVIQRCVIAFRVPRTACSPSNSLYEVRHQPYDNAAAAKTAFAKPTADPFGSASKAPLSAASPFAPTRERPFKEFKEPSGMSPDMEMAPLDDDAWWKNITLTQVVRAHGAIPGPCNSRALHLWLTKEGERARENPLAAVPVVTSMPAA